MRFLFSFAGGAGHFMPTAGFARALARRGHEILYACQEGMVAAVAAAGWRAVPSGGASLLDEAVRRPLAQVDRQAEERVMRDFFAGTVARERAYRLAEIIKRWQPDMVVRDEADFGGAVAAEAAGLPHAAVVVIAAGRLARSEVTGAPLAALRSEFGLRDGRANDALHRYLLLVPVPPSFRDPQVVLPATARFVRPAVLEDVAGRSASEPVSGVSRVYFTLGTIFPQESGDLFQRVLAGLSALPVEVTVTTGEVIDPAEIGSERPRVRVERYLPLTDTVACSDVVVSHGGSGTVIASLALGLPQVLLPMGADQPDNAERCRDLGIGLSLNPLTASPSEIAEAVATVLETPTFRASTGRLADEASAQPDADHAARVLEDIARTRSPVTALDRRTRHRNPPRVDDPL